MPRDNHVVREIPSEYFCPEHRRCTLDTIANNTKTNTSNLQYKMLRVSHLTPIAPPAFSALRVSLTSTLNLSSPFNLRKISTFAPPWSRLSQTFKPNSPFLSVNRVRLRVMGNPCTPKGTGEDLSDLAAEYSICPSKEEGGMLGWVKKGQMVPEFEETAFSASLNKVVRCKTKFGWHLLQVLSEREESLLQDIQCEELHVKMQDPSFLDEAQLIDVREPEEVAQASLSGFQVLPLRKFGSWGPDITTKFDPQKDTYVMCHHGVRSLQVAKWLQTQGFKRVFNVSGGIHEYATRIDQTIPTY